MKQQKPETEAAVTFTKRFRKDVHQLIAWGVEDARPLIKKTEAEETITNYIRNAIRNTLQSTRDSWWRNYDVHNEEPISTQNRTGKDRKEIDLLIKWVTRLRQPEFVFEAKPLNFPKKYQRSSNYINNEGMGRFIKGDYASFTAKYPEAGMLGYVMSDTSDQWRAWLQKAIYEKGRTLKLVRSSQQSVIIIDAIPLEWVSKHQRKKTSKPFTIYHILVSCR